jgi:2-phospho-L-lactate guanylyltransferase
MRWTTVVPLKPLRQGKSRLRRRELGAGAGAEPAQEETGDRHEAMVLAFARDTLAAVAACEAVGAIVLVCDEPTARRVLDGFGCVAGLVRVVPEERPAGLNAAIEAGEAAARAAHPDHGVAALSADLPALTPAALADALAAAAGQAGRAFVADRPGDGTTMLCAPPDEPLRPRFGPGSAAAHAASGAARIAAAAPLRTDVDTPGDLAAALELGVGPATAALRLVHLAGGG